MLKADEIRGPSCLTSALDDEPIFVLRANDELAPQLVRWWSALYQEQKSKAHGGMSAREDAKYIEAQRLAGTMEDWRAKRIAERRQRNRCEYNPARQRPATDPPSEGDCPNDAAVSLGADGAYHVCASCADLPELKRYRVRTPLRAGFIGMRLPPPIKSATDGR
jgi:hypothetical protein